MRMQRQHAQPTMTPHKGRFVRVDGQVLMIIGCGLIPKVGALISSMPIAVLGGAVVVMFGMVVAAGINMLGDVVWTRRNMVILAVSLSVGLGLQAVPEALQHLPATLKVLLSSVLLPVAFLSILLNAVLPEVDDKAAI